MSKENKGDAENLGSFTTRMDPDLIEKVRAIAWYKRMAQREIIEAALEDYLKGNIENVDKIISAYRDAGSQ